MVARAVPVGRAGLWSDRLVQQRKLFVFRFRFFFIAFRRLQRRLRRR